MGKTVGRHRKCHRCVEYLLWASDGKANFAVLMDRDCV